MSKPESPLLIIDGYGFIFRAYHVQPPLTSPEGEPVGAIYGFTSMLLKLLSDFKPEHAVIVLDHEGKNFRHDIYDQYKANRPPAPDDLKFQLKLVEKAAKSLNFHCISKRGFEADDLIATLVKRAKTENIPAVIISADKDLMQLIDGEVKMYDPAKYKYIGEAEIVKKFGVTEPTQVREVQALIGDKSDNIPGVPSVGPKTAAQLISQFGTVKNIIASIEELSPRQQKLFSEHAEAANLSWQLVGLDEDVEINYSWEDFQWQAPDTNKISDFINKYGFKSLRKRVENLFKLELADAPATPQLANKNIDQINVAHKNDLNNFFLKVKKTGQFAIDINNKQLLIAADQTIYSIDLEQQNQQQDLFMQNVNSQLVDCLRPLLHDPAVKKITWDPKEIEDQLDIEIVSYESLMIMDYVLNAGNKGRLLGDILQEKIPTETQIVYYCKCYDILHNELFKQRNLSLYYDIDRQLYRILRDMEKVGIKIDSANLNTISAELAEKISVIEKKIYDMAGTEFNIASPKQLGTILFDKLNLPFGKMQSKSQSYVTNVDILEKLKVAGHAIADLLLEYRHLSKLKNTYVDTLPKQVQNGRIHTNFQQCSTTTSRLSSANPNLQNIPIRTAEGERIRSAFIAQNGHKLIAADYSQIELRILSHIANIGSLKEAFAKNRDIHAQTASQIFKVPLDQINSDLRRKAKAINFGIIYGISAFGLAKQLSIGQKEAGEYIKRYFTEYPGIEKYMQDTIEFAKQNGYVENIFRRKCHLPYINDKNHALRSFASRAAINAPMQGTAADIVKFAMIKVSKALHEKQLKTKMILQVHDELIFEAPENEVSIICDMVKKIMEEPILDQKTQEMLNLKVDVKQGINWQEI